MKSNNKLNKKVESGLWEVYDKSLLSLRGGGDDAGLLNVAKECLIVLSSFELTGREVVTNGDLDIYTRKNMVMSLRGFLDKNIYDITDQEHHDLLELMHSINGQIDGTNGEEVKS